MQLKPLKLHEIPEEPPQEPLKEYTEEELDSYKLPDLQYQISILEEKLNANKPNLSVIDEFLKKREAYLMRVAVLEEITAKRNEMRQLYDDVRKKRFTEFMRGFHIITKKLKEMYQMITLGGDAELELVDSMDPFNEGIVFSVRPPKKSWKMISNLSGGEKTLSSLALVFALHYYKPSPLYVMDEIDAALDFKNVSIVAHYIKVNGEMGGAPAGEGESMGRIIYLFFSSSLQERTKNAQFIIISLRSNMFELSDYLVGIYKVKDCTDSVTIKNDPMKTSGSTQQQQQMERQQFGFGNNDNLPGVEEVAAELENPTEAEVAANVENQREAEVAANVENPTQAEVAANVENQNEDEVQPMEVEEERDEGVAADDPE